ncbi:NlpC/P60 family protein [Calidifontibacter terrae]
MLKNKKIATIATAGAFGTATVFGGMTLATQLSSPAHADTLCVAPSDASAAVKTAIRTACNEVHKETPYVWGGGHGDSPGMTGNGFDCSGLLRYAWYKATGTDWGNLSTGEMSALTSKGFASVALDKSALQAGDVIVYRHPDGSGHTVMYIGAGRIVEAPATGIPLRTTTLDRSWYNSTRKVVGVYRYQGKSGSTHNPPPAPVKGAKQISIYATSVNVRRDATSASARMGTINPSKQWFTCQKRGQQVSAHGYTNALWSYSPELRGYIANVFMSGPSDYRLPACGAAKTPAPKAPAPKAPTAKAPAAKRLTIWATDVNVRKDATSRSTAMGKVQPSSHGFTCQKRGQTVTDGAWSNDLWSYSPELHGYVNNVFMKGPANFGLPSCGGAAGGRPMLSR